MGPEGACEGVVLCILFGPKCPYLLRPNKLQDGEVLNWNLVDPCYVYGIMYGEGLDMGPRR